MPMVDTLGLKTRLSQSGMPESQAQVLVEELDEALTVAINGQVATKADIADLKSDIADIKVEMAELRGTISAVEDKLGGDIRVLRWTSGTIVVIQLGILAKLLFP